jgi:hypothetical protein
MFHISVYLVCLATVSYSVIEILFEEDKKENFKTPITNNEMTILNSDFWHWCTIGVPSFLADFEIIPIPMFGARFMGGWERGSGGGVR